MNYTIAILSIHYVHPHFSLACIGLRQHFPASKTLQAPAPLGLGDMGGDHLLTLARRHQLAPTAPPSERVARTTHVARTGMAAASIFPQMVAALWRSGFGCDGVPPIS
jgi:hypothetical protein